MGASVFVCARGGTIVTCAATSGYMIEYDNRHLWMKLKRIVSSHFANYREAWDMNRLIDRGRDPADPVRRAYPSTTSGEAAYQVHHNLHEGKIGVLLPGAPRGASASTTRRSGRASARTGSRCSAQAPDSLEPESDGPDHEAPDLEADPGPCC